MREAFRPFAPAVLLEEAPNWFDFGDTAPESPFMLRVVDVKPEKREQVPAIVHVDGTGRVQTLTPQTTAGFTNSSESFTTRQTYRCCSTRLSIAWVSP
jgi:carbamoyltransferase